MKKTILTSLGIITSLMIQAQTVPPPTSFWPDNMNNLSNFRTATTSALGVGTLVPRGWQEILYCNPLGADHNGLVVTKHYCNANAASIDPPTVGDGTITFTANPDPVPGPVVPFTPPLSYTIYNSSTTLMPLLGGQAAPLMWIRTEHPQFNTSMPNNFQTKFIVTPEGKTGINVADPRAALDVRGTYEKNHPVAIFGRAINNGVTTNGITQFNTQHIQIVSMLGDKGYNPVSQDKDQGIFFTDGLGTAGANQNGSMVIAPWVADGNQAVGGLRINSAGNIMVQGDIEARGNLKALKVNVQAKWWSDFVFDADYKLMSLSEVEAYIAANKHLPNVPSEADVLENGIDVANMQAIQQQKIEELTLYIIQLKKEMDAIKAEMEFLKQ